MISFIFHGFFQYNSHFSNTKYLPSMTFIVLLLTIDAEGLGREHPSLVAHNIICSRSKGNEQCVQLADGRCERIDSNTMDCCQLPGTVITHIDERTRCNQMQVAGAQNLQSPSTSVAKNALRLYRKSTKAAPPTHNPFSLLDQWKGAGRSSGAPFHLPLSSRPPRPSAARSRSTTRRRRRCHRPPRRQRD